MKSFVVWLGDHAFEVVFLTLPALVASFTGYCVYSADMQWQEQKAEHQLMMSGYTSPASPTDSDRLDWLDKHRTETPWVKWESDPRKEIDFMMDNERKVH